MSILAARSRSYLSYERTTAIGFPFLRTNAVLSFLERSRINFAEISLKSPILWGFSGKVKDHYFDTLGIKITVFIWRRRRDSNPCYAINVNTISNRAPSSTQPLLHTSRLRRTFLFEGVIADATLTIIPYFSNSSREKLQFFDLFFYTQREIADPSAVASLLCGRGLFGTLNGLKPTLGDKGHAIPIGVNAVNGVIGPIA